MPGPGRGRPGGRRCQLEPPAQPPGPGGLRVGLNPILRMRSEFPSPAGRDGRRYPSRVLGPASGLRPSRSGVISSDFKVGRAAARPPPRFPPWSRGAALIRPARPDSESDRARPVPSIRVRPSEAAIRVRSETWDGRPPPASLPMWKGPRPAKSEIAVAGPAIAVAGRRRFRLH